MSADSTFLYVKIPAAIMPLDRGEHFEDPLDDALQEAGVGEVTGGGSMMKPDGGIEYVGIDVDVTDLEKALPIIREVMQRQGAPEGSVIEEGDNVYPIWLHD